MIFIIPRKYFYKKKKALDVHRVPLTARRFKYYLLSSVVLISSVVLLSSSAFTESSATFSEITM